ncbi:MAG TPA: hypothetical protein PK246_04500 [Saprospiraceae bacterium]|nr:hypothetical protein [Lewinellaceae bacterium]HPK09574.1 hypothetical protein [Saprospiraceae bacterium]
MKFPTSNEIPKNSVNVSKTPPHAPTSSTSLTTTTSERQNMPHLTRPVRW